MAARPGLGALLVLFMCLEAMVLLNGLIGVFGDAFVADVMVDDDDDDDDDSDGEGGEGGG